METQSIQGTTCPLCNENDWEIAPTEPLDDDWLPDRLSRLSKSRLQPRECIVCGCVQVMVTWN